MEPDDLESVSEPWRQHLLEPVCGGALTGDDVVQGSASNAACGDVLELFGARRDGRFVVRFRGRGCWAVTACASALCERLDGLDVEAAARFDPAAVVDELGGLPRPRRHALALFERALRELRAGGP